MKIAEALALRKANNDQMHQILKAIAENAYSDHPDDNPNKLLAKYLALRDSQEKLIRNIEHTNLNYGLSKARLRRDMLIEAGKSLSKLPKSRTKSSSYAGSTSGVFIPVVLDIKQVQIIVNQFSREARKIDGMLQSTNWTTDLIEQEE